MVKANQVEQPVYIISMARRDFIGTLILGAATGLLIWLIGMLLNRYLFDTYFCQGDTVSQCGNAKNYAVTAATLIGGSVALAGLIRLRVYRPLLVLVASLLSAWGIIQLSWDVNWLLGLLAVVALYALAFGVFSWVARLREFWITLVCTILLVIAVRLVLMA